MPDVDAAAVAVHALDQQPKGRLAAREHRLAAVADVQVRQRRHAPLQQQSVQGGKGGVLQILVPYAETQSSALQFIVNTKMRL